MKPKLFISAWIAACSVCCYPIAVYAQCSGGSCGGQVQTQDQNGEGGDSQPQQKNSDEEFMQMMMMMMMMAQMLAQQKNNSNSSSSSSDNAAQQAQYDALQNEINNVKNESEKAKEALKEEQDKADLLDAKTEALAQAMAIVEENKDTLTEEQLTKLKAAIAKIKDAEEVVVYSDGSIKVDGTFIHDDGTVN